MFGAEIEEFIKELDADKDGGVSWEEYVQGLFSQVRVSPVSDVRHVVSLRSIFHLLWHPLCIN